MKKFYILIFLFVFSSAWAGNCSEKFSWLPNTDIVTAGYKIYYGTLESGYINEVDIGMPEIIDGRMHGEVKNLDCGVLQYFVGVAYSSGGIESTYSNHVSLSPEPKQPAAPKDFRVVD